MTPPRTDEVLVRTSSRRLPARVYLVELEALLQRRERIRRTTLGASVAAPRGWRFTAAALTGALRGVPPRVPEGLQHCCPLTDLLMGVRDFDRLGRKLWNPASVERKVLGGGSATYELVPCMIGIWRTPPTTSRWCARKVFHPWICGGISTVSRQGQYRNGQRLDPPTWCVWRLISGWLARAMMVRDRIGPARGRCRASAMRIRAIRVR
jgi:hypothetical protein